MNFYNMINRNTFLAFKGPEVEITRSMKAENFEWDKEHPNLLSTLCIRKLATNWNGYPTLDKLISKDRELFLQLLSTDSNLDTLVKNIDSDIFWKRFYKLKWKDLRIFPGATKWLNRFMQRYFAEYLENLNPSHYDPEKINELVKLCGPYIQLLEIRSLIPFDLISPKRSVSPEMAPFILVKKETSKSLQSRRNQKTTRDHISLHAALGSLVNLTELHVTFQLKNIGYNYRKDLFQFTNNDAKNLSSGLEKCQKLKVLRITRSNMNCQRLKYILRGLTDNKILETIDFSHCKIAEDGILAIAKFLCQHENVKNLVLADNNFGQDGAESISHALNHSGCGLRMLDLSLNNKLGSEGIAYIAVSLARGSNLTALNISGCGIRSTTLTKPISGVWSTISAESPPTCGELLARAIGIAKTPLRTLDISVNDIGSPSDAALANAICLSHIVDVMLKRSGMSPGTVAIAESAAAAQKLRREAEKGVMFRTRAGRVVQARRVVKGMNIDADPMLLAQQLSARPSIVSIASEDGIYNVITQALPADFAFIPTLRSPLLSSRASSVTGPPTSRRSSHHVIFEPLMEIQKSALIRRGSDGSLLRPPRHDNAQRHIKIFVSK